MYIRERNPERSYYRVKIFFWNRTPEWKDKTLIHIAKWIREHTEETMVNFDGKTSLNFETTMTPRGIRGWCGDALERVEPSYGDYELSVFDIDEISEE